MKKLKLNDVVNYVEKNIGIFHQKRILSLDTLKLSKILKRKNPYLFKAKHLLTAEKIVTSFVDAHISSNEETVFGDWLEEFAIFINHEEFGGQKSGIKGVDLEFNRDNRRYIVSIKSGPNWGNSSQISKMRLDFKTAKKTLRTSNANINIECVNGCCYGRDNKPDKGDYFKYCGQKFWEFISGNSELYTEIIVPLGHNSHIKNQEFMESYSQMINKFALEFAKDFCDSSGAIDWHKLVMFNSSASN